MRPVHIWEAAKDWFASGAALTHHELHLIAGTLLYLAFGSIMRRPLSSLLPILPVAALEAFNEWSDYRWFVEAKWLWNWQDAAIDVALTLGLPLAIALRSRLDAPRPAPESPVIDAAAP